MRVMVVGSGGREHALVWKIAQSSQVSRREDLVCVPGNAGIEQQALCLPAPPGGLGDVRGLADLARAQRADLVVVGPELPLTAGLVDELESRGIAAFGATRRAAQLEGSKIFAKRFMQRHGIPTAAFDAIEDVEAALRHLDAPDRAWPLVVKADGLAAGKGVVVAADRRAAREAVIAMMRERRYGDAGARLLLEECLTGVEASFFALSDGERAIPLATCQDYKRVGDGDTGPNTGGMGAYSPSVEFDDALTARIMQEVIRPTIEGMAAEGAPYRGVLYAGLMLTARGPMVLEYNARFGDPETQVLMPRLEGDFVEMLLSAAGGRIDAAHAPRQASGAAACVVLASRGYPESSSSGQAISGLEDAASLAGTVVFHAGTRRAAQAPTGFETAGGRVLADGASAGDVSGDRGRGRCGTEPGAGAVAG
jgi:phosphoribosylamine--glycine ligase